MHKNAKVGTQVCQIQNKPSNKCPKDFLKFPKCQNLPNLITLMGQLQLVSVSMELFSRCRIVSAQLSNKFGYCPLYTVSIVL